MRLDPVLARSEPDPELHDLILASGGLNLALDYLPGSLTYTPAVRPPPDADLASALVWFDAYVTNVDRTARNPNLLVWHARLWLIDHGAALYFHHTWQDYEARSRTPFPMIQDHVLLPYASAILAADARLAPLLSDARLAAIVAEIPDEWLAGDDAPFATPEQHRAAYLRYLVDRLRAPRAFAEEGGACPRPARPGLSHRPPSPKAPTTTPCSASSPASSEASASTSAPSSSAAPAASCAPPSPSMTRACWPSPPSSTSPPSIATWMPSSASPPVIPTLRPIAQRPQGRALLLLVAPASAMIQASPVHTGLCADPAAALARILDDLVRQPPPPARPPIP